MRYNAFTLYACIMAGAIGGAVVVESIIAQNIVTTVEILEVSETSQLSGPATLVGGVDGPLVLNTDDLGSEYGGTPPRVVGLFDSVACPGGWSSYSATDITPRGFRLTQCERDGGVQPPDATLTCSVDDATVEFNSGTTVRWAATNSVEVGLDGDARGPTGTLSTGMLHRATTYGFNAYGIGSAGAATCSVKVDVHTPVLTTRRGPGSSVTLRNLNSSNWSDVGGIYGEYPAIPFVSDEEYDIVTIGGHVYSVGRIRLDVSLGGSFLSRGLARITITPADAVARYYMYQLVRVTVGNNDQLNFIAPAPAGDIWVMSADRGEGTDIGRTTVGGVEVLGAGGTFEGLESYAWPFPGVAVPARQDQPRILGLFSTADGVFTLSSLTLRTDPLFASFIRLTGFSLSGVGALIDLVEGFPANPNPPSWLANPAINITDTPILGDLCGARVIDGTIYVLYRGNGSSLDGPRSIYRLSGTTAPVTATLVQSGLPESIDCGLAPLPE